MKRTLYCLFGVSALFAFSSAANSQVPMRYAPYTAFEYLSRGMTTPSGSTQIGMALPAGTSIPTTPVNLSGWQLAGNFGANQQSTYGQTVGGKSDFALGGGAKAPINVSTPISNASLAASAGMVLKNAARIGVPAVQLYMTASAIKDLYDLGKVYFAEDGTPEKPLYTLDKGQECSFEGPEGTASPWVSDPAVTVRWGSFSPSPNICEVGWFRSSSLYGWSNIFDGVRYVPFVDTSTRRLITPEEATALISAHQARADILQQLINSDKEHRQKNGVNPFGYVAPTIGLGVPSITGPATVPGPKSSETESVRLKPGTNVLADPGTTTPTDPGTKVTTKEQTHKLTYEGDKITQTTVNNTVINITNNTTNITTTEGEKVEEKDPDVKDPEDPPTDTPLGDIPLLYERKYPEGLKGIWDEKSAEIKQTPLFNLAQKLMPTGLTSGTCPSWHVDLSFGHAFGQYGNQDVSPPCWIWGVAKIIIIASALILARALVFGG